MAATPPIQLARPAPTPEGVDPLFRSDVQSLPLRRWQALAAAAKPPRLPTGLDAAWAKLCAHVHTRLPRAGRVLRRARRIDALRPRFETLTDGQISAAIAELSIAFRLGRHTDAQTDEAVALVCEAARRRVGLRPHVVQIAGALAMLTGCVAEMATGEGKTLTAALAAVPLAWRGRGCHVITVNDYLARRDTELLAPLYDLCGLSVAYIEGEMGPALRRAAYAADITYCTNKEVTADYVKDRLALGPTRHLAGSMIENMVAGTPGRGGGHADRLLMRGLHYAIVDEADSVLIDEAVTPLIISGDGGREAEVANYAQAARVARSLIAGEHYRVDLRWQEVRLTPVGDEHVERLCARLGGAWERRLRREELIVMALTAQELYQRDRHYVISEGRIVIIDEFTGRLMPDRTWRGGLHQAVEAKESVEVQPPKRTLASISFQRFFRMYPHLCGMTGTGWEARLELWRTYGVPVVPIPTHRPGRRVVRADRLYPTAEARWSAVLEEIERQHAAGRAVLVGTRSVEASELIARRLAQRGLACQVLNAVRHAEEAAVVARAGESGRITVATNMAGRGTDIKLAAPVVESGGLHVIATQRNEAERVDRQLFGRCARQGDPGSCIALISLDDDLIRRHAPAWARWLLRLRCAAGGVSSGLVTLLIRLAQGRAARAAAAQRRSVVAADDWLDETTSFTSGTAG